MTSQHTTPFSTNSTKGREEVTPFSVQSLGSSCLERHSVYSSESFGPLEFYCGWVDWDGVDVCVGVVSLGHVKNF